MIPIHQPHNKFFKKSLKEKAIALDFLKAHLPQAIQQRSDLSTLHLMDTYYVTPQLSELHSDLVYQCQIDGKPGYIPILFLVEHQSTADVHMAFRLLQYTVHLIDDHLKAGHSKLPLVLPLCLYHGPQSPYPYSTDIYEDFDHPTLAKQWVFKPFHLIDLTILSEESIQQHGAVSLLEILFKYYHVRNFVQVLKQPSVQAVLRHAIERTTDPYLKSVLHYLVSQNDENQIQSTQELLKWVQEALPNKEEAIMTFADQLINQGLHQGLQQGLHQGLQQGLHQGKLESAKSLLSKGLALTFVKEALQLTESDLKELEN